MFTVPTASKQGLRPCTPAPAAGFRLCGGPCSIPPPACFAARIRNRRRKRRKEEQGERRRRRRKKNKSEKTPHHKSEKTPKKEEDKRNKREPLTQGHEFEIEEIIDERQHRGRLQYKVRWMSTVMDLAPGAPPLAWGGAREGARYRDFVSRRLAELES